MNHDFLWRAARNLPERGRIGIFNRSYYEEVLIVRVHPELLVAERVPGIRPKDDSVWAERYRSIGALERHLHVNGTRVICNPRGYLPMEPNPAFDPSGVLVSVR